MIRQETRDLVALASDVAERIFRERGRLGPIYHVIHADGRTEVIPAPPGDKDTSVALMRAYFTLMRITRYVLIDECWRLDMNIATCSKEEIETVIAFCNQHGVEAHPRRMEAVMFVAEDEFGQQNAWRKIERPARGKARLGPLVFDPEGGRFEGRMVGMLVPAGRPQ